MGTIGHHKTLKKTVLLSNIYAANTETNSTRIVIKKYLWRGFPVCTTLSSSELESESFAPFEGVEGSTSVRQTGGSSDISSV